jgi:prolyl-tRNA editing enzyme YbaK/EbsC (Cys-tRNA(Pro) deacylase)
MSTVTVTIPIGSFSEAWPLTERPDLVADAVIASVRRPDAEEIRGSALVVDTDPGKADTAVFCDAYDVSPDTSANCVVVAAKRGGNTTLAACVVLASTRIDVNRTVRTVLGARKASFAAMETAVAETGMEYGGITPIGLPDAWPILIDKRVAGLPHVLIGSGQRRGRIIVPGPALASLPGAMEVEGLGT